ncbi:hypothetical protein B0H19DRAFT_1253839 [Mycena capillaripes]|nr:hypothetical protein B0H19DRAFT_1253839 [Mycena capillaripes]
MSSTAALPLRHAPAKTARDFSDAMLSCGGLGHQLDQINGGRPVVILDLLAYISSWNADLYWNNAHEFDHANIPDVAP